MKTLHLWLLRVTRFGLFLVPFIPLVIWSSNFFPFITGKGFTFRIIVEVIFACWLLLAFRDPTFRPKESALLWSVTAFIGVVFLADAFAINPFKAFWSNFERMEGFVMLAHLFAYFLIASSVFNEEKWWHRFFVTSVGVSAFLGIYGVLQLAGKIVINQGGVRVDGTFGNAAYFAGYMLVLFFLTLFLIVRQRVSLWVKWLYGGAFLLQLFVLYFSATRGSAVGLAGGLLATALLVIALERNNKKLRIGAALLCAGVILISGSLYFAKDSPLVRNNPVLERFSSISVEAAGPRFMVWGMAFKGFKEHPMLGWGQEGFNYVFNTYYDPNMWSQEQWFDRTHNIFFDWLISAGLLGLLAYLSLFVFLLWYIWKGVPTEGSAPFSFTEKSILSGLLFAYVVHNFFVFDNLVSYILFFSLIAYIHARVGRSLPAMEKLPAVTSEQALSSVGVALIIVLAFSLYFLNFRAIRVSRELISALQAQQKGVMENLALYKKAFAVQTIGSQEVAEQAMQTAMSAVNTAGVTADQKKEFIDFAVLAMNREMARAPKDTRLRMFIGGFYNRLGRSEDALAELEKAHMLSPTKQTVAFELASTYLNAGKTTEALALLKKAFESAPDFSSARIVYAVSAIYAKEYALANTLFASTTDMSLLADERLVRAYYEAKQFDKVISLLKLRLESDPKNPQTHVSLAAAHFSNGNREEAIKELQKTIELNPDFKAQGQHYIDEIKAGRTP